MLVGIPKGVVLADGRDVGGWSRASPPTTAKGTTGPGTGTSGSRWTNGDRSV